MSRAPNNPELHELANRLSTITYTHIGPYSFDRAPGCHRHNGHIRVTRNIRHSLLTLGITSDMNCAAFYSDCLTAELYCYTADLGTAPEPGLYNDDSELLRADKRAANPQIVALASAVVGYLKDNEYLRDYPSLFNSRRMTKIIIADFEKSFAELNSALNAELAAVRDKYRDRIIAATTNAERARESLAQLYKL